MRKMYASPKLECTPVNTRELMETASVSVGGPGNQSLFLAPERGGIGAILMVLLMLLPMSLFAWNYSANGNVLSAYGEGGYTSSSPLSITLNEPADLQFDGNYKPATISNTAAWEAAGLSVPTILYDGKTNAPSMLGTYMASISAGSATAEVVYTIKSVIDYKSFFHDGLTQGINYDIVAGTGKQQVALNNPENKGVYWDPVAHCAVFDGEAYLQIDNPLGDVTAATGFTLTMDVWISSNNNGSGYFYRSTGASVKKSGWQRLFDLSDGHEEDCIFINAGNANSGTAHLMWCLRKGYGSGESYKANNTGRSYWNQWCTLTLVVAPGGYTTLYVNGEMLTHSISSDISKIVNVLNSIHEFDKCFIGTSIFEAGGGNADGFFYGKIRGFQTAEGALMPYYDGSSYHYLLSYETNGGNPITGTFEATIPNSLPTPTHSNPAAVFNGWYLDEALTIPVTTGVALTKNTSLYAKWNNSVEMAEGTVDAARWSLSASSAPEGSTVTVNYSGDLCPSGVMIRQKVAQTIYMNNDNRTTAVNSYNGTPNSRIELIGNLSAAVTFTKEGEIDLKGHSTSEGFLFQHNEIGQTIIVKNGSIRYLDGKGGFNDFYKGTVVLEDLTINNDVWTDGHAYIIKSGTYASIQNYKNSATPGTVTIYDGNFAAFNSSGGGTYTLYGGRYAFNPSSRGDCTIPSGYSVVDHGSGTYRYEVVGSSTPAVYPYDLTVTEVTPGHEWTFVMPRFNVEVDVDNIFCTEGTESDPYLVPSTEIWNFIARKVNSGKNYAGKFFRQTADFGVTTPIGNFADNQPAKQKPFSGTYNGDGHTLNVNIVGSANFTGPFFCLSNATVKNLVVTGSVTSSYRHASGLVGTLMGPCSLENCLVSTNVSGTDYMGGLIGHSRLDGFTITGCVFNGTLTATGNGYTGGFNGWGGESVTPYATITNSLFAGHYAGSGKFLPVGCFAGANATRTVSNVYYTQAPTVSVNDNASMVKTTSYKGEFAYSITAGTGVTVAAAGTPTASYNVSGLDFYGENGLTYNGVIYGGNGDAVSLDLDHAAAATGYSFSNYSADHGTLTGSSNPYTLTMANANSVISANYTVNQYTISFNSNGGSAVDPITQDYGTTISAPADPTRDYYSFDGWSPALPATMPAENMVLTAQWTPADMMLSETDVDLPTKLAGLSDGQSRDITITRTFVAGPYNTCCLPFSLTASQIESSPLAGATLKDYNGADVSGEGAERDLNIHLIDLEEIVAGRPFLIKPDVDIVNPTFTGVTVTYTAAMGELVERDHVDFQGILAPYDLAGAHSSSPDYLGIGMDGRLQWADASLSGGLPMRGFRAFFHVKDAGAAGSPVRRGMRAQFVEDSHKVPTAVDNTTDEQSQAQKIIRNGQVLILRDGKLYNALGAEVK